jgi:hypothetical protein
MENQAHDVRAEAMSENRGLRHTGHAPTGWRNAVLRCLRAQEHRAILDAMVDLAASLPTVFAPIISAAL